MTIIDCHKPDDNDPGAMLRRESKRHGSVVLSVRVVEDVETVDKDSDFADWIFNV